MNKPSLIFKTKKKSLEYNYLFSRNTVVLQTLNVENICNVFLKLNIVSNNMSLSNAFSNVEPENDFSGHKSV